MNFELYTERVSIPIEERQALSMLGISLREILNRPGQLRDQCLQWSFRGDREVSKEFIEDYLLQVHFAFNIRHYARPQNPRQCYTLFDARKHLPAPEEEMS